MDQTPAVRDALRILRVVLVVQLLFLGLSFLLLLGLQGTVRWGPLLRAAPTLLLVILFLPPWLEKPLGRAYLAVALSLQVLIASVEGAYLFTGLPARFLERLDLPAGVVEQITAAPPVEPFFFLLIPLVLMAWGYGRRGALLGSTLASVLHLAVGFFVLPQDSHPAGLLLQVQLRIVLLYTVPLLVSLLAARERQQHRELQGTYQRLRRHAATVEQLAVSRERNRLARDLHDTLAHSLSALAVQLEALRTLLAHDPVAAGRAVDELLALARRGLDESRQAIRALRTDPVLTLGLAGALRELLQAFQARTGIPADLVVAGQETDLTAGETQALYRIADEALTNVERHAAAGQVAVRLACGSDRVDLSICDDGGGFDPADVDANRYGLAGMNERAALIGATLEVHSQAGGGTQVWCRLPR